MICLSNILILLMVFMQTFLGMSFIHWFNILLIYLTMWFAQDFHLHGLSILSTWSTNYGPMLIHGGSHFLEAILYFPPLEAIKDTWWRNSSRQDFECSTRPLSVLSTLGTIIKVARDCYLKFLYVLLNFEMGLTWLWGRHCFRDWYIGPLESPHYFCVFKFYFQLFLHDTWIIRFIRNTIVVKKGCPPLSTFFWKYNVWTEILFARAYLAWAVFPPSTCLQSILLFTNDMVLLASTMKVL